MKDKLHHLSLAAALLGSAIAAYADDASTTFSVTASVGTTCTVTAQDLNFGTYDPLDVDPTDGSSQVSVYCTEDAPFSVYLSAGVGSGATVNNRLMTGSGVNTLAYQLYTDSGYTEIWGDGTIGTGYNCGTGLGASFPVNFEVYGQIAAGLTASADSYTDTITVDVIY